MSALPATPFVIGLLLTLLSSSCSWYVLDRWEREVASEYQPAVITSVKRRFARDFDAVQSAAGLIAALVVFGAIYPASDDSSVYVVVGAVLAVIILIAVLFCLYLI